MKISRILYAGSVSALVFFSFLGIIHAHADDNVFLHRYVGDETCEVCHSSIRIGQQFQSWKGGPHAKAYRDLKTPESLAIARKFGIADPTKDARCLSCHTTAHGAPLPEILSTFRKRDGVQCESCHGPGEDYAHFSVMIDPVKSRSAGLIAKPPEDTCKTCHNPSSPTYKGFDYKRDLARIAHPVPEAYKKEVQELGRGE